MSCECSVSSEVRGDESVSCQGDLTALDLAIHVIIVCDETVNGIKSLRPFSNGVNLNSSLSLLVSRTSRSSFSFDAGLRNCLDDFVGRGEVTGDMVTSEVEFVDEGGKVTAHAKEGNPSSLVTQARSSWVRIKTVLTTEMLEFSGVDNPEILTSIGIKPKIDLPGVSEDVVSTSFAHVLALSPHTTSTKRAHR
jgi:hypothetical protein